jgi:hypothetical protein
VLALELTRSGSGAARSRTRLRSGTSTIAGLPARSRHAQRSDAPASAGWPSPPRRGCAKTASAATAACSRDWSAPRADQPATRHPLTARGRIAKSALRPAFGSVATPGVSGATRPRSAGVSHRGTSPLSRRRTGGSPRPWSATRQPHTSPQTGATQGEGDRRNAGPVRSSAYHPEQPGPRRRTSQGTRPASNTTRSLISSRRTRPGGGRRRSARSWACSAAQLLHNPGYQQIEQVAGASPALGRSPT